MKQIRALAASLVLLSAALVCGAQALNPSTNGVLQPSAQQMGGQSANGFYYAASNPLFVENAAYANSLTVGMSTAVASAPVLVPSYASGSLAGSTTYYIKCVPFDWLGNYGVPSAEANSTMASAGSLSVTCTAVANAAYYQVWIGTSSGSEANYTVTQSGTAVATFNAVYSTYTSGTINTVPTSGPVVFNQPVNDKSAGFTTAAMTASNSSTLANITNMTWPIQASKDYVLRCDIPITFVSSATIQFALNGPGSPTSYSLDAQGELAASAGFGDFNTLAQTSWQTKTTASGAPGAVSVDAKVYAFIQNGTSAGALSLQYAGNGTNNVQILANASCTLTQTN